MQAAEAGWGNGKSGAGEQSGPLTILSRLSRWCGSSTWQLSAGLEAKANALGLITLPSFSFAGYLNRADPQKLPI